MRPIQNKPAIGITMGDPAGIGPEIIIKALNIPEIHTICNPIVLGDKAVLQRAISLMKSPLNLFSINHPNQFSDRPNQVNLIPISDLNARVTQLDSPTPASGKAMQDYILAGVHLALDKSIQGLVTAPITKTGLKQAKSRFHGHTELIAHKTATKEFAMMLAGPRLKVVLVTIHIPLAQVSETLTIDSIVKTIDLTHDSLIHRFGIPEPKLAVAGLNPHAGESSMFGKEEENIIVPAIGQARKKGYLVEGPLPPDTVFHHAVNGAFDAVICMYHDQGLIPFKMIHFKDGVNTTLGLPIIRTSVDHGTAYDIAWKGIADPTSLKEAIKMAVLQANVSKHKTTTTPGSTNGC